MKKASVSLSLGLLLMLGIIKDLLCQETKDWVIMKDKHVCVWPGSSVVMSCSLNPLAGHKVTDIFWVINSKVGDEPPDLYGNPSYTGRVQYYWDKHNNKNNCTLKLTGVKGTDSGVYKVRIITRKSKWLSDAFLKLTVTELAVQVRKPVVEGGEVKLSCTTTNVICSLKGDNVIWRKNGQILPNKQTKLLLKPVRAEHEGEYSCALKGHEGHPSTPVKLNVMFSPKNISLFVRPDANLTNGESVTLTCSSDANPPVESYTWFKMDESTAVGSGQQYSITNIRSVDGGQYYCEARNKYGAEKSSAVSITVTGARSPVLYVVAGVSVCGAAGLICVLVWIRGKQSTSSCGCGKNKNRRTDMNMQDDVDYENDPQTGHTDAIQMRPVQTLNPNTTQPDAVYQSLNPNTTQPDAVYQSLNPNTTQPDPIYQTLNPNTTQPDPIYQTLNPNTTQPDAVYQSLNPNTTQPDAVYQSLNPNTTQPDPIYQTLNPNTTQPDPIYQSLNPNTTQPDAVYQSLNPNTTQPDPVYQTLNPNTNQPDPVYQSLNPNTTNLMQFTRV
ncbi:B-cell receptor CD22-like [Alosa sapidissima]|uniref:B-cell receptor CD22-like n=1 Tax=Alosa sapidissima TaxID=34773 RepID=UPI001C09D221|nr:B-cell receptor CD22-like [Alosa sapidissima]